MHDLDTALLRTFMTLAETGSFTRTAERVGRSQSAVSMQMRRLEDVMTAQLFNRGNRMVTLTPDGEKLLSYARQMVNLSDSMIAHFTSPAITGEVTFGSPEDFTTTYLPDILARFAGAYPDVTLHVNCELTRNLIAGFEARSYDLIVIKQPPDNIYSGARPLWREQLVWVASPKVPADTRFDTVCGEDNPLQLVLSPAPCVYRERALEALDRHGVQWDITYTSPSIAGATAAVRAGLGIAVLPRKMVPPDLTILDQARGWPPLREAEMCLLACSPESPAIQALSSFITSRLGEEAAHYQ
jgi:DNA-binding transcriptional LysR family regulator